MRLPADRLFYWAPRALVILLIAFVSIFALDVFDEGLGFWRTIVALAMHLIPSFILLAALLIAWRWERIGALEFAACGVFFAWFVGGRWPAKVLFTVPCFLAALLFLADWRRRAATSAARRSN